MAASKPNHEENPMTTNDTPEPEDGEEGALTEHDKQYNAIEEGANESSLGGGSITVGPGGWPKTVTIANPEQWNLRHQPLAADSPAVAPPKVYEAIMTLMDTVQSVGKGGLAPPEAGGYRFRSLDDLLLHVGPAARSVGLAVQSRITACEYHTKATDRHTWTWCRLRVMYRFTSLEDGSTFEFESAGEGRDNTDKATSKAMSMALKYGLSQAFLIDLGEPDPDGEKPMDTPEGDVQRQRQEVDAARREQQRQTQANASRAPQQRQWDQERPAQRQQQYQPAPDAAGRARQALAAAQHVKTQQELTAIAHQAQQEGLMGEQIGGVLLGDRLRAIGETLP